MGHEFIMDTAGIKRCLKCAQAKNVFAVRSAKEEKKQKTNVQIKGRDEGG